MKGKEIDELYEGAMKLTNESNGHLFETIVKTKCVWCGKSPEIWTSCQIGWFRTFKFHLSNELKDYQKKSEGGKSSPQ